MKCVDYIIKIPGCDDILFCAGLSFEEYLIYHIMFQKECLGYMIG